MPGNRVMSRQHLSQTWHKSYDVDNVWFDLNDLFADHIEEVMEKWDGIDDQIWGKVIVMEKNCRVAKMFLSKSEMAISNDHCGFDLSGRIGLRGFDNKMRDSETATVLRTLGKGCSVWMDLGGEHLDQEPLSLPQLQRPGGVLGWSRKSVERGQETV